MKTYVNVKELENVSYFKDYIEKARKGEQVGGEYIYRENITEKTSTGKDGKEVTRRYKYYYISDLLKDSADKILKNIGSFFFKGKPEEVEKIKVAYEKENIEKDYGADRKTWYQHCMEYFSHRDIWDKRFAKKENAEKFKKPIKQKVADKVDDPSMETPTDKVPEIKTKIETTRKDKPKWKANPSLMRKVWSLYTGKDAAKEEKAEETVKEVIQGDGLTEDEKKQIESYVKKQLPKEVKYAEENTDVVKKPLKDDDPNKLTPEEEGAVQIGFPRFMGLGQLKAINQYMKKGEEKEFYRGKVKELAGTINKLKDRWYKSYDDEKEKHFAGLHLFDANSDWYITEWDGGDEAFGYAVLNGDTEMAEWGPIDLPSLQAAHKSPFNQVEVDLYYDNSGYVEDQLEGNNQAFEVTPIEDEKTFEEKVTIDFESKVEYLQELESKYDVYFSQSTYDALKNIYGSISNIDFDSLLSKKEQYEKLPTETLKVMLDTISQNRINSSNPYNELENCIEVDMIHNILGDRQVTIEEHNNRSLAMMGNQNAKKWGITEDEYHALKTYIKLHDISDVDALSTIKYLTGKGYKTFGEFSTNDMSNIILDIKDEIKGEQANAENNTNTQLTGISDSDGKIRSGNNQTDGSRNGSETETGSNRNEPLYSSGEPGIGLGGSGSGRDSGSIGTGRLSKTEAKKIREKCREILAKPDSEITAEDKEILKNYEGAGGLHEGDQSDAAVLSEFYTPRDVIKKVWEIVDKYNPNKNKKVIEPSAGTGRFAENRDENFTLCELDETSARIAHLLHPDADVKQGAFQKLFVKNNSVQKEYKGEKYDVAVGNPPYGDYTGMYKGMGEGKIHTRYEEYFIDRTLDTLKDDGIMAFVVPSGFLRGKNSKAKEAIAKKGKLLEAWRLPKGTFSSTDVGTDIIVIRKEPGNIDDFNDNKYFKDNAKHVIGTETFDGNWGSAVINLPEGKTVAEAIDMIDTKSVEVDKQIAEVVENIETKTETPKKVVQNLGFGDEVDTPKGKGTVTGFIKKNGKTVGYKTRVNGELVEIPAETEAEKHQNRSDAMKGNDNAKKLIHKEKETTKKAKKGDTYVESDGHSMSADEFSKKYGKDIPVEDLKFWKKTNWEGVIEPGSLTDAEAKEIAKNSNFIKDYNGNWINVANFASGNIYEKLDELEEKIGLAEISQDDYNLRKSILDAALPPKKTVEQFTISPLSNFSKTYDTGSEDNLIDKFLYEYCGFSRSGSTWGMKLSNHELDDNLRWEDIWDYIHQKPVITERARGWNAEDRAEEAETNKMIANQRKQARRETAERLFNEFLRKLPKDEQDKLEKAWNTQFNAIVNPDFKKIPLFVEGLNTHKGTKPFDPTDQQIKGITELCNKGNGILAYDVGVGKTFCGIVATVNQLQTGKAKKPLIIVPKSVYKKWIKEIHQHFPEINVNELGNFSEKNISKYKGADGKYNFPENSLNVCTYEALQKITFKEETLNGELRDDMLDSQSIYDYDENGNLIEDTRTEREKAKANEDIMKKLGQSAKAKDGAVFWEDLGIDHLTVDELHNFKNIFSIPSTIGKSTRLSKEKKTDYWGRTIKEEGDGRLANEFQGLSGASSSRGMKMFAISQLIQRENDGRGFFGLSATPFNNSPVEIYNILSLCARNRLKEMQIFNLQDFLREFAELKPDFKVNAKGEAVESQTMKNFKNLGALQNLITEFIDKVDGEEAGVVRPRKQLHMPELDLTPLQKQIMEVEKMRMDGYFSQGKDNSGDVLVAMNNMRMAVLSPSLVDPKFYADYEAIYDNFEAPNPADVVTESPKLQFVCDSVVKQFKERPTEGQVIYMPRGVGKKAKAGDDVSYGDKVNGFQAMKDYLVSQGMPEDSIAFMNSDTSLDMKEQIKDDFNDPNGKIKVIIGSETIKEGVSLNGNSTTLYNTMLGWNPTETIQVEGRIWRQGNKQGITHIVYPLMNDSIDAMMYQKYDEKSSRLNALWSYKGDSLNVEDYNPEEVKYELIKDPEKRANMKIMFEQKDLKKQLRMENARYDNLYETQREYNRVDGYINQYKERLPKYQADIDDAQNNFETAKADVEKAKKTLATAKKAKDDDLIEMANSKLEKADSMLDYYKDAVTRAKSELRVQERNIKELEDKKSGIETYWQKQGVKDVTKINEVLEESSKKRQEIEKRIEGIKDQREQFIKEATEQLMAEKNKQKHLSVEEVVNQTTKDIKNNLRVMDAELKAEIRAELEQRYPHLKKSLPLFFIKDGRFMVRR